MDWEQARGSVLNIWTEIRKDIGPDAVPADLLSRIHAVNDFCAKAKDAAGQPYEHCPYCPFYQQFGGCKDVTGDMSEKVLGRDWSGLADEVDDFIDHLRQLEIPAENPSAP